MSVSIKIKTEDLYSKYLVIKSGRDNEHLEVGVVKT